MLTLVVPFAVGALATRAHAQDSTRTRRLQPVRVTVTREGSRSVLDLPFGVSRLQVDSGRSGIRRASLTELLINVPGLAVSNRYNPTQDPRLAIRGFGARSAFGIRGVRVVRDGVPLTLADGQTAVDFVDLEGVGTAEVMRG
ncbi:MAG: Plug domain-containing protein, partial [Gemmatimonadetes bacterium]|nr:Plug domain-containing protein [Gemmatimonadota bacterium]